MALPASTWTTRPMPEALLRQAPAVPRILRHSLAEPRPEEQEVLSVEDLLAHRGCRRLGIWRARRAVAPLAVDPRRGMLPLPWPARPPGWSGSGRSWGRPILEVEGIFGQADWLLEVGARPLLVMLGDATRGLRARAGLLSALLRLRGNVPLPVLRQPWPIGRLPETWLGDWPSVLSLRSIAVDPVSLLQRVDQLQQDLASLELPRPSAPRSRCWDCPARELCGDRS